MDLRSAVVDPMMPSPPAALDLKTFRAKFPFINVTNMPENVGKFLSSQVMDRDALYCFTKYIFSRMKANEGVWYGVDGSIGDVAASMPRHLDFFACFCKLSKAFWVFKQRRNLEQQDVLQGRRDEQKRQGRGKQGEKETEQSEDEVAPVIFEVSKEFSPAVHMDEDSPDRTSSSEGPIFNDEDTSTKGVPIIVVKSFCTKFLRENKLDPRQRETVEFAQEEKKMTALMIIRFKDDSLEEGLNVGLFGCASSAIDQAMENIDMHKDKQIYLLVCGNMSWCFGTLTLADVLATGTEGKSVQPVGELCIKHSMFRRSLCCSGVSNEDFLLIESLLRVMLGDAVLLINEGDAHEIVKIIKDEELMISKSIERRAPAVAELMKAWRQK